MAEHHVSVEVNAPVHEVYALFTHFNDFPKFMSFVKEVTYLDEQHSHWVVDIAGRHEWDAVNEDWIEDSQVGWRSIRGLTNNGKVIFQQTGPEMTQVNVFLTFVPPAGTLGRLADYLAGDLFDKRLNEDLQHFARMVAEAPAGALDPMSSHYLFHRDSAVATHSTTDQQNRSMAQDPSMTTDALQARGERLEQEDAANQQAAQEREDTRQREAVALEQATRDQEVALGRQAEIDRVEGQRQQAEREQQADEARKAAESRDPVLNTLGGRSAAMPNTPLGDRDARNERFPGYERGPAAASPKQELEQGKQTQEKEESPWRRSIRGEHPHQDQEAEGDMTG